MSVFEGLSTNIVARAGSDAELSLQYQWYLNNAPYAGATSTNLILSNVPIAYNGAQIYLVAAGRQMDSPSPARNHLNRESGGL